MLPFVYCVCACIASVLSESYNGTTYTGRLAPSCINHYYRIFVTRRVPPRNYKYFHEVLAEPGSDDQPGMEEYKWRIVGGSRISIQEAPYTVLYGLYCGGTLIAPEWVITAAHCKDKETFILAGSTQRSLATSYPICAHFLHPLWKRLQTHSHDFDYQLVLLEAPVPITPNSMPIAIGNVEDVRPGDLVGVSGWGHLKYKPTEVQDRMQENLRRVMVPIMSLEVCRHLPLENYHSITTRMFCAGYMNGTKDSCQGDSGGPVVLRGKLVGLVSFGVGCAVPNQPGVYSNIPMARDWIRSITALPL